MEIAPNDPNLYHIEKKCLFKNSLSINFQERVWKPHTLVQFNNMLANTQKTFLLTMELFANGEIWLWYPNF